MANEIHFYILAEITLDDCYRQVCHLIEKHYEPDKNIYIHTTSRSVTELLNDLLWTFHDTSFLPHAIFAHNEAKNIPILIGDDPKANPTGDILVNLTEDIPPFYHQFQKIFEIVPDEEIAKIAARTHYQFYKEQGYKLITHKKAKE
jgi:DNA polymerase III subunit chi